MIIFFGCRSPFAWHPKFENNLRSEQNDHEILFVFTRHAVLCGDVTRGKHLIRPLSGGPPVCLLKRTKLSGPVVHFFVLLLTFFSRAKRHVLNS